jgi:glycosyltransferase involved in cell wall biosynthesis
MTEAVEWTGYLGDRAAYLAALADADVFCLPSRAEGVPKALVEAMALGVPVVATPVGDVPAVLGHGERGRLVRGGDELGLARAIDEVLQDREASAAMATRARAWAAERTSDRQAERLVERLRDWFPDLPWPAPASG